MVWKGGRMKLIRWDYVLAGMIGAFIALWLKGCL